MSKNTAKSVEKKPGKMKKIIMVGGGGVALLAAGIGGGAYFSGSFAAGEKEDPNKPKLVVRSEEPEEESSGEGGEAKEPVAKVGTVSVPNDRFRVDPRKYEATYFTLDQAFTSNLADGNGFVQVGLSLSTYYDSKVINNIKRQMVPVRSAILLVLSQQDAAHLSTPEGKAALQKSITDAINEVLRQKEGFGGVDNVYFTNLVIQ